jgi:hypothetical protein
LARALVSAACWWSGFRAISDDDYSRVVIAARFAAAPSLDPSGTSWLPLPFWLYGVPMAVWGDSLDTARAVAFVCGALSAVLVWVAARLMGLSERAALLGALGAIVLPYGAWLSCATVPEAPTAAWIVLGVVTLSRAEARLRFLGGLSLAAACFCRYEAWAPAATFALLTGLEAVRTRRKELLLSAATAIAPIALWLLHGAFRHGSAFFFVTRVSQYRAALGEEGPGLAASLFQTPWALLRFEPELMAVVLVALGLSVRSKSSPFGPGAWRPLLALLALVVFLMLADASGGAATHHPERSLLPVFWFLALIAAGWITRLAQQPRAWLLPLVAVPVALLAHLGLRPPIESSFVDRREEEQVGELLRRLGARDIALDTPDFGFFALQAAIGYGRSWPLQAHDPRLADPSLPGSSSALAERLRSRQARWLVTTRERAPLAATLGKARAATTRLTLIALDAQALRAEPPR